MYTVQQFALNAIHLQSPSLEPELLILAIWERPDGEYDFELHRMRFLEKLKESGGSAATGLVQVVCNTRLLSNYTEADWTNNQELRINLPVKIGFYNEIELDSE